MIWQAILQSKSIALIVSFRSGFYSTDHYHGNDPYGYFYLALPQNSNCQKARGEKRKGLELSWYKTNERGKPVCLEKALFN